MNKNINKELSIEKGLIQGDNNNLYIQIENFYKYLFERYLLSKVNIKSFDEELKNSKLDFGIPNFQKQNLNIIDYLNCNYILVLNSFFIEKLDINDINALKNKLNNKDYSLDDSTYKMIERTFKEVIKNNYHKDKYEEKVYKICYGEDPVPSNFADNDALVLLVLFSKNKNSYNKEEYVQNIVEKKKFLKNFENKIKLEVNKNININCELIIRKVFN